MIGPALAIALLAAGVPALDDAARRQLETANDFSARLDGPALYPLLENALRWPDDAEAGARVPDFERIRSHPAEARGELFLIEGALARVDDPGPMSRPGPWSGELKRWIVQAQKPPNEVIAVVYLVDPPEKPLYGTTIRTVGRFYKIWRAEDLQNEKRDYPVFVGHGARIENRAATGPAGGAAAVLLSLVVLLAGVVWWLQRRVNHQRHHGPRGRARRSEGAASVDQRAKNTSPGADEPPLPGDPAEALGELAGRAGEEGRERG